MECKLITIPFTLTAEEVAAYKAPENDLVAQLEAKIAARLASMRDALWGNAIVPLVHNDGTECHCKGPCRGAA